MGNRLPATDIASYAAAPTEYCRREGGAYDPLRAKQGVVFHEALGAPKAFEKWLPYALTAVAIGLLVTGLVVLR